MKKYKSVFVGIGVVIVTLIVLSMCTTKIKPGYVGVVYSLNGGIKGQVLTQGLQ